MGPHRTYANKLHVETTIKKLVSGVSQSPAYTVLKNVATDIAQGAPFIALWDTNPNGAQWTKYVAAAIQKSDLLYTVPQDYRAFCSVFPARTWKKAQFWVYLISCVAYFETEFNWHEKYQEAPPPKGPGTVSAGLLQLSVGDDVGYKCPFGWKKPDDVCNPQQNLTCGVHILQRWVLHDGVISGHNSKHGWLGGARYWSTLRPAHGRQPLEHAQRWCKHLMDTMPDL